MIQDPLPPPPTPPFYPIASMLFTIFFMLIVASIASFALFFVWNSLISPALHLTPISHQIAVAFGVIFAFLYYFGGFRRPPYPW